MLALEPRAPESSLGCLCLRGLARPSLRLRLGLGVPSPWKPPTDAPALGPGGLLIQGGLLIRGTATHRPDSSLGGSSRAVIGTGMLEAAGER